MNASRFSAKVQALPSRGRFAISRIYPRMTVGGAESDILVLLEGIGDTQMIVTEIEGPAAQVARQRAKNFVRLEAPRFFNLWTALQASDVVHLHTINDHPLAPLAAQFSGAATIVQTVHNDFDAESSHFVDHSIVVAAQTSWRLAAPDRCSQISSGIEVPRELPARTRGGPVRLLEIRRADKPMAVTLEQILATGALDGVAWTATVVGMDAPPGANGRINYVGLVGDTGPYLRDADVLVHGSAEETFGRAVFEALANGLLVFASRLSPFEQAHAQGAAIAFMSRTDPVGAAQDLFRAIPQIESDAWEGTRERNRAFVANHHGTQRMIAATRNVYADCARGPTPPRNFSRADVVDGDITVFCSTLDALLERRTPPSIHQGILSTRQQAILTWLGVRFGVIRASFGVPLLESAAAVLGPRHLLCMDLANAHSGAGQLNQALAWSAHAVELDPQKVGPYVACALLCAGIGRKAQALDWLSRIEARWPLLPTLAALRQRLA